VYWEEQCSIFVTRYGLDGPGIETQWWRNIPHAWTHPANCTAVPGLSFLAVKRPGRGADLPPSFSAQVKERVELYLYPPSGSS